jgi:hypothetical protein
MHKGPKGMPKRMGPKIRDRNKGKMDKLKRQEKKKQQGKMKNFQPKRQPREPKVNKIHA